MMLQRHDVRLGQAIARTFLIVDPRRPPDLAQLSQSAPEALVLNAESLLGPDEDPAALAAAVSLCNSARASLSAELWLRVCPPDRLEASDTLPKLARLVDGLVLPRTQRISDIQRLAALLEPGGPPIPVVPVFETSPVISSLTRVAKHPQVRRLAAARTEARTGLVTVSRATGLPAPVNALTPEPADGCAMLHDAVVARNEGFGGQCVTAAASVPDVQALYRGAGSE